MAFHEATHDQELPYNDVRLRLILTRTKTIALRQKHKKKPIHTSVGAAIVFLSLCPITAMFAKSRYLQPMAEQVAKVFGEINSSWRRWD